MALIIDANTPTCCGGCFFLDYDTNERPRCFLCGADITKNVREQTKHTICPILGEIPDEHGVLGDISDLAMSLYSELETQEIKTLDDVMKIIKKVFDDAPTVVEASK